MIRPMLGILLCSAAFAQLPQPGGGSGGAGGGGDSTAVSNSGAGAALLKSSTNVTGRTITGTNVTVTENADTIDIAVAAGSETCAVTTSGSPPTATCTHNLALATKENFVARCWTTGGTGETLDVDNLIPINVNSLTVRTATATTVSCIVARGGGGGGGGGGGSGTVTSVAITVPAEFSVSGSPITSSGTLAISKANQTANLIYAGPASGGAAAPTFRALVAADLPGGTSANAWVTVTVAGLDIASLSANTCEAAERTTSVSGLVTGWDVSVIPPWEANKTTLLSVGWSVSSPGVLTWRVCNNSAGAIDLTIGNFTINAKPPIL